MRRRSPRGRHRGPQRPSGFDQEKVSCPSSRLRRQPPGPRLPAGARGEKAPEVLVRYEVQFTPDADAPFRARALVAEGFAAQLAARELDIAKLLTSELVTNAVVHGEGMITMRADLDERRLLVEVIDRGRGFDRSVQGNPLLPSGGWGLRLVASESSRWGVREGATHVWFEIERPGLQRDGGESVPDEACRRPAFSRQRRASRSSGLGA